VLCVCVCVVGGVCVWWEVCGGDVCCDVMCVGFCVLCVYVCVMCGCDDVMMCDDERVLCV